MIFVFLNAVMTWSLLVVSADTDLKRLDPHGKYEVNLKQSAELKNNCSVCHTSGKSAFSLKPEVIESCVGCHNKSPHSGVPEHMGKMFVNRQTKTQETISCMSCHSPHRFGSKEIGPSSQMIHSTVLAPTGFAVRPNKKAMLRRTCVECHTW